MSYTVKDFYMIGSTSNIHEGMIKRGQTYQDAIDFISLTYQKMLYQKPEDIGLYLIGESEPPAGESFKKFQVTNSKNVYQTPDYQLLNPDNVQYLFVIRLQLDNIYNSVKIIHPDPNNAGLTMYDIQRFVKTPQHLYISEELKKSFLQNPYSYAMYKSKYVYNGKLKYVACQNYFKDPTTPYNSSTNNNQVYVFYCGYLP